MAITDATGGGLVSTIKELPDHVGRHLGYSEWEVMTQARVNLFADATDDYYFIHVDPVRAERSSLGSTIAHGYLMLSLIAPISNRLMWVTDASLSLNYGLNRVRFIEPLRVGAEYGAASSCWRSCP
jgi:acyl dehydratase